ncbi:MAG: hypothetical protein HY222_04445 [Thaumarchaeota archaeon]|nr:hypothetical protein [Nitrososphaerota archaeon]MBI3641625.1 hypothetical protein [Nitrososphaerota archaeon]
MKFLVVIAISLLALLLQTQLVDATGVGFDKKAYTWTNLVHILVYAPDFDSDPNLVDTIDVSVSTSGHTISPYKLVETGTHTGIFAGDVTLTGDPILKGTGGVDGQGAEPSGTQSGHGPNDGFLPSENSDGVTVSFAYNRDQTITGSALIQWNSGQIKWLEKNYQTNEQGVLQIIDPDMNLNPKAIDKFETSVWSDSDSGGTKIAMSETGKDTGIFQGTVYFTNSQSSGGRLYVTKGDTITGEYVDRTLPYPHSPSDEIRLTTTTIVGIPIASLEQVNSNNPRIVDSLGNAITTAKVNQQILIEADLKNMQQRDQPFAYLVQIEDSSGVTLSLSWITGTLTGDQFLNLAESWLPPSPGKYTAQIFVWQSLSEPNALSPPLSITITVA